MPYLTGLVGIPNLDRKALKKQTAISNLNFRPLKLKWIDLNANKFRQEMIYHFFFMERFI